MSIPFAPSRTVKAPKELSTPVVGKRYASDIIAFVIMGYAKVSYVILDGYKVAQDVSSSAFGGKHNIHVEYLIVTTELWDHLISHASQLNITRTLDTEVCQVDEVVDSQLDVIMKQFKELSIQRACWLKHKKAL